MLENTLFETHFNIIPFPIYVVDVKTYEILFCNSHFKMVFGEHSGTTCYKNLYHRDEPCIGCKIPDLIDDKGLPNGLSLTFEHFNETNDDWYQLQEKGLSWPDGRTVKHSIAVDITELKETQNKLVEAHAQLALKTRELENLASYDSLTGIFNRLSVEKILYSEIDRTLRYDRNFSFIIVDIDRFKDVNDKFGHQVGDDVLIEFSRVLGENLRKSDSIGRWGGEEFVIICPEADVDDAWSLAEKLRVKIAEHEFIEVGTVTASFGVAQFVEGDTERTLLKKADNALYSAKQLGRNQVVSG